MSDVPPPRWLALGVLGVGLLAVAFGAILVRLAQAGGAPSLVIAAVRLGLAALLITPYALYRARPALWALSRAQWGLSWLAGACLALHFGAWIASLEYTSIASSTALVNTNPLWICLASLCLFGEKPKRMMLGGVAFALMGSLLIFWSDSQTAAPGKHPLLGNLLALIGSWGFSAYLLIGRRLRVTLPLIAYIWLAYGTAALFLVASVPLSGLSLSGYGLLAWAAMAGLALGPQLLGHTAYSWSLRYVSPTFVSVVTLGEPIGSAALGFILLNEGFTPSQFMGFALLLTGIYFAARSER